MTPLFSKKGFTLVEILITISIFSVAAIAIYSVFSGGMTVWKREKSFNRIGVKSRIALEKLTQDVKNMVSFSEIKTTGSNTFFSFPGLIPASSKEGDVYLALAKITYFYNSAEKTVYKNEEDYQNSQGKVNLTGKKVVEFVDDFDFKFYVFDTETEDYQWLSDFSGEEETLKLFGIKVDMTYEDENKNDIILSKTVYLPVGRML